MRNFRFFGSSLLLATLFIPSAAKAQNESGAADTVVTDTVVIDDFESGVGEWSRNDKSQLGLSDIVPTKPTGGAPKSLGAALVTFKSAKTSWASVSRPIDGPALAKIGAKSLVFWINGGGEKQGVGLQLRAKSSGSDMTFTLPQPIRLDLSHWRKVAIPLSDFKGPKGEALAPRLNTVYLLQFQQSGTWESRFFSLDDMVVKGTGVPISLGGPVKHPASSTPTETPAANETSGTVKIGADFLKASGSIRTSANVSIGSSYSGPGASPLETSAPFRSAMGLLRPRFVRLDIAALTDLTDSSRPSFDFTRLINNAARVRALKAEPLIAVTNPSEWGLDAHGYATLASDAAKALNRKGAPVARYFELVPVGDGVADATTVSYYNAGYAALKILSKNFRVGGFGAPAGALSTQTLFLKGASGLDFLTVSSFGAQSGSPSDELLMASARDVADLKTAAGALDKSRFARAPLFVTQAGLSTARNSGDTVPSDIRLVQGVSGAWWAQFMASGSRLADQIFHNDAVNPEWGLLDASAQAYPAYYSAWLWNTFFPAGSVRVATTSNDGAIFVSAANSPTAHNLLLVNTTGVAQTAQIAIRGFPVLREARIRIFDDPKQSVRFEALPKSPFQTVKLAPFAIAVVQFIEPPKKK